MSQPARKAGDPGSSKFGDSLPSDDPSIPVLTERLTLPPLDLNLEFRLPERPAPAEPDTVVPLDDVPIEPFVPIESRGRIEPRGFEPIEPDEPIESEATAPIDVNEPNSAIDLNEPNSAIDLNEELEEILEPDEPAAPDEQPDETPAEEDRVTTVMGTQTSIEPPEPTETSPRVPSSLLVSNIDALLATPPGATLYQEPDEFGLTQPDGSRPNRMETELREMILLELARRVPTEVEAIVRRHLDKAIEEAIRRFAAEVRIALAGSLREIVDRAVKAELDRLNVPRG